MGLAMGWESFGEVTDSCLSDARRGGGGVTRANRAGVDFEVINERTTRGFRNRSVQR